MFTHKVAMESRAEMVLMRMLGTGTKPESQRGLSFIELLVVLVIMGLVSGVAILSLPKRPTVADQLSEFLSKDVEAQRTLAIIHAQDRGIDLDEGRLVHRVYQDGEWRRAEASWRRAPKGLSNVSIDIQSSEEFILTEDIRTAPRLFIDGERLKDMEISEPDIRFTPTGEVTPAVMTISDGSDRWSLQINGAGKVTRLRE